MTGQIILGDCLEEMAKLPAGSIDLIATDLPYGTTKCAWDSIIELPQMWQQFNRVLSEKGAVVLTCSQPFTSALVMSNPKQLRQELIWKKARKTGHLNCKKQHLREHENILIFSPKSNPTYNPQMKPGQPYTQVRKGKSARVGAYITGEKDLDKHSFDLGHDDQRGYRTTVNTGERYPSSILEFNHDKVSLHPTQKPVSLFEYLIKTYSNPGETVLDITAGSGTTGAACQNTGRNFILIENNPAYCEIMRQRLVYLQTAKAQYVVN